MGTAFWMVLNESDQYLKEEGVFDNNNSDALEFTSEQDAIDNGFPQIIYGGLYKVGKFWRKAD
jgi:hypothetical protein